MKPGNLRRVSPPANGRMGRMFFVCLFDFVLLLVDVFFSHSSPYVICMVFNMCSSIYFHICI